MVYRFAAGALAGTKWNAFIDAGCASHMKNAPPRSLSGHLLQGVTAHQVIPF
ncbi:hypothetical protein Pure05_32210 [Paenarthrobacter ureafaciens]|nr:hypothetical protein ARZXY2_207 [Arthrobacter sp. ZXY-2]GLU60710.1 hypothetical protein Pure01_32230 [Paenarthrobacter ureafaciens]GLU64980.1 hypothetical protein Pure02_32300 [Paenarthrobacter ureafaciens]GLU69187.1 hypothetical protein Pure03_31630 [Paenarthrobacter ureafaciens]GLU73446.1 hypothetical protein Pure04_31610 [Paenarthrobacter ureafaciens]